MYTALNDEVNNIYASIIRNLNSTTMFQSSIDRNQAFRKSTAIGFANRFDKSLRNSRNPLLAAKSAQTLNPLLTKS